MNRRLRPSLSGLAIGMAALAANAAWATSASVAVVDADGKPLADAVVWAMVKGTRMQAAPGTNAQIAQRERQFQPQLSVVQTGTSVWFPNFDTVRHHVYSFSPIQRFELRLYAGTPAAPVVFDKAGVAALGCNIHDRMQAWVVVVDTPFFTRTDTAGTATLDLPPGDHRLRIWHALMGDSLAPVERSLTVGATLGARLTVALPRREAAP
ncbi:MAG: methylamine utilization protein [Pseudomonadota bacterium]